MFFAHQCRLCACARGRRRGRRRGRWGFPRRVGSPLVFIVSSCSIRRFGWPMRICPSPPPSCDSNVLPWMPASTHSLTHSVVADKKKKMKSKKITNPLRADSLGILPPILLLLSLLFACLQVVLSKNSCFYVHQPVGIRAEFIIKHHSVIFLC